MGGNTDRAATLLHYRHHRTTSQAQIKRKALYADAYFPLIKRTPQPSRRTPTSLWLSGGQGRSKPPPPPRPPASHNTHTHTHLPQPCLYMISGKGGELGAASFFLSFFEPLSKTSVNNPGSVEVEQLLNSAFSILFILDTLIHLCT